MAGRAGLKMKPAQAKRAAEQALELANKDKAKLNTRLEAGVLAGLTEDAALLRNQTSSAQVARAKKRAATKEQDELAATLTTRVKNVRAAVKRARLAPNVRKAVGVGRKLSGRSVPGVLAAAEMVIDAYSSHADALRSAGILPADIDVINGEEQALAAVDQVQEGRKVKAKLSVAQRNGVQRRVEAAIDKLIGAAEMEFGVANPERADQYRALIPSRARKRKPTPA